MIKKNRVGALVLAVTFLAFGNAYAQALRPAGALPQQQPGGKHARLHRNRYDQRPGAGSKPHIGPRKTRHIAKSRQRSAPAARAQRVFELGLARQPVGRAGFLSQEGADSSRSHPRRPRPRKR